jgi:hypothetical protein
MDCLVYHLGSLKADACCRRNSVSADACFETAGFLAGTSEQDQCQASYATAKMVNAAISLRKLRICPRELAASKFFGTAECCGVSAFATPHHAAGRTITMLEARLRARCRSGPVIATETAKRAPVSSLTARRM